MLGLKVLVLFNRVDQLLKIGLRPATTQILHTLSDHVMRTMMLFSATMPPDMKDTARFTLRQKIGNICAVG